MHPSTFDKLIQVSERLEEVQTLLSDPEVISDQKQYRQLMIELSEIEPIVDQFNDYRTVLADLEEAELMMQDDDAEIRKMAAEEFPTLKENIELAEAVLQKMLIPKDPNDRRNVFLEIRAGTGGDEAAIFSGDLYRMYYIFSEKQGWKMEIVSANEGEHGGYKEVITKIIGTDVYSKLKFESGAHRVQRVPETESQGRIHTSACTVAVMPEADEMDEIEINTADLRVDTYRASGAGGQHVNKTDSAVRITHLPTGIVVECQDERSQHKNRARAMSVLQSRLLQAQIEAQQEAEASTRKSLVGSGDRSEKIRTYNYPQSRVTDHRINLTLYRLDDVMSGALDQVVDPLLEAHQADQLAQMHGD